MIKRTRSRFFFFFAYDCVAFTGPPTVNIMGTFDFPLNHTAVVNCRAVGTNLTIFWTRVDTNDTGKFIVNTSSVNETYKSTLIIEQVQRNANGRYRCFAHNSAGKSSATALLRVLGETKLVLLFV